MPSNGHTLHNRFFTTDFEIEFIKTTYFKMLTDLTNELQNQKIMAEVRRNLWSSSGPTRLPKKGHLGSLPRAMSRKFLKISKDGDSATSVDNPCNCSITCTVKTVFQKCFLMFRRNLLCFTL